MSRKRSRPGKRNHYRPKHQETSAADMARLGELARLIELHSQAVTAQAALVREDIGKYLPLTMATFEHYKAVAEEFIALASRFNLTERHAVEEALRIGEAELTYLRNQCVEVPASDADMPVWPIEIDTGARANGQRD